jgi:hypothetical protein
MTTPVEMTFTCRTCGSDVDVLSDKQSVDCIVCGAEYVLAGHLCPHCQYYHDTTEGICVNCGTTLSRICRRCQSSNWSGSGYCLNCGSEIDLLSSLSTSQDRSTVDRLSRQMREARDLKKDEEISSAKRMAELLAIEEARQAELRQRFAKQKQQERQMLAIVFGAVAIFLIIIIIFALITSL